MNTKFEMYFQASNPACSPERLRQLAADSCSAVRLRVAENSSTPADVLEALSRDENSEVRQAAASNPALGLMLLWELATDTCPDVRYCIAENPQTEIEILIWLSGDENPYVALRAEKSIESTQPKGGITMSAKNFERTVKRLLNQRKRLNKHDAIRLRDMVLADGYVSRSERKVIVQIMERDLLDDDAFDVFVDVLLHKIDTRRAIA